MAYICNENEVIEHRYSGVIGIALDRSLKFASSLIAAHRVRRQQRIDRKAFLNLMGREDWLYRDMGIHEGDVLWASTLPIEVNAALELEKIKRQNLRSI